MNNKLLAEILISVWPERVSAYVKEMALTNILSEFLSNLETQILAKCHLEEQVINQEYQRELRNNAMNRFEVLPVSSLVAINITDVCMQSNVQIASVLRSTVVLAMLGVRKKDEKTSTTIREAATAIRKIITLSQRTLERGRGCNNPTELVWAFCDSDAEHNVSQSFARLVEKGWERLTSLTPPPRTLSRIRVRGPNQGGESTTSRPSVNHAPLSYPTPDPETGIDIDDEPQSDIVEFDNNSVTPIADAQRKIFRKRIQTQNDQFGFSLLASELSNSERISLRNYLIEAGVSDEYILFALTFITSLTVNEVLGVHLCIDSHDLKSILGNEDAYGIIDLSSGVYWRRDQVIQDSYKASSDDKYWLERHYSWAPLPIPKILIDKFRFYLREKKITTCQVVSLPGFNEFPYVINCINNVCRYIRNESDSNRKITKRSIRRVLFSSISQRYGPHNAALILANNEFAISTWHYYMALPIDLVVRRYVFGVKNILGDVDFYTNDYNGRGEYIGSELVLSVGVFRSELSRVKSQLDHELKSVHESTDLDFLRNTYNKLVSYTLVMCMAATCHRRNASCCFEHTCWSYDYSQVLVADKIHDAESATRYIPVPKKITDQIKKTFAWIEQIASRVRPLDKTIASTLLLSTSLRGGMPFLGTWTDENKLLQPNTNQIKALMGERWNLPFNTLRQCVFQRLLQDIEAAPFLSSQMGHIGEGMHIFQNTSLHTFDSGSTEAHRRVIDKVLDDLGFEVVVRTKFTYKCSATSRPIWPSGMKRKNQSLSSQDKKLAKSALKQSISQAQRDGGGLYEHLAGILSGNTSVFNIALEYLQKELGDIDSANGIDEKTLLSAFNGKYQTPSKVKATLPFETAFSSKLMPEADEALDAIFRTAISGVSLPTDTLNLMMYVSLLLDGLDIAQQAFTKGKDGEIVEIRNIREISGFLIGDIRTHRIMFAGRSALLLLHILEKQHNNQLKLDKKRLSKLLENAFDDKLGDKPSDHALRIFLKKLRAVSGQQRVGLTRLATVLSPSPRPYESGVLFGIRHHTLDSVQLSEYAFKRLVNPSKYFATRDDLPERLIEGKTTHHRPMFKRRDRDNNYFKDFAQLFRDSLDAHPRNPHDGVVACWNMVINTSGLSQLGELQRYSKELPELIFMTLTWLFNASQRAGKSRPRVATSTIKTYFSRIVPLLWDEVGSRSLIRLDYDELLQHYQNVIDAGDDIDSRGERARNLADFHRSNYERCGLCDIDFNDLDVETPEKPANGNIITPNEYETALKLLLTDECSSTEERYINASILILCYRLGLRRMECARIMFGDWNSQDGLLYIHSNRFGRTKSVAGNRRIPYRLFLNETEQQVLDVIISSGIGQSEKLTQPIFGHPQFPEKLRRLEPHFNRVIEALKVSTGDVTVRLHDCRHSFITFVASGLVLDDDFKDDIAKTIRSWFKQENFSAFLKEFVHATIKIPTTKAAYLPALALMVGHSSAKVTIRNYLHLTDYWRWIAIEQHFRSKKSLDSAVISWSNCEKQRVVDRKRYFKLSSSFAVLPELVERIHHIPSFDASEFPNRSDENFVLSKREFDSIPAQLTRLQEIDGVLRHLEYLDQMHSQNPLMEADVADREVAYQLERNNLTQDNVDKVNEVYQKVLQEVVAYRSYGVLSNNPYVTFPEAMGQSAAAKYLDQEEFYEITERLLRLKQSHPEDYHTLLNDWAGAWDSGKRTMYLLGSKCPSWQRIFRLINAEITFGEEKISLRNQLTLRCKEVESINLLPNAKILIRLFGHVLFLLTMLEHSN